MKEIISFMNLLLSGSVYMQLYKLISSNKGLIEILLKKRG